jgi:hypothetical protein
MSSRRAASLTRMETTPPHNSAAREIVTRAAEAGLSSIPGFGSALAVAFVTAVSWRLEQRREEWFTELAEGVEELREQLGGLSLETLLSDGRFTDAVVSATRTVEHTDQAEKIRALRHAVLNSVLPGAPDADTQAILLNLVDRFTGTHLRMLALWCDPPGWFASHQLPYPTSSGNRALTVDAGMPEMQGRRDLTMLVASELHNAGLLGANLAGMVSSQGMMQPLATDLGRQLVKFVSPPGSTSEKGSTG